MCNFHPEIFYIRNIWDKLHATQGWELLSGYIDREFDHHSPHINAIDDLQEKHKRAYLAHLFKSKEHDGYTFYNMRKILFSTVYELELL